MTLYINKLFHDIVYIQVINVVVNQEQVQLFNW